MEWLPPVLEEVALLVHGMMVCFELEIVPQVAALAVKQAVFCRKLTRRTISFQAAANRFVLQGEVARFAVLVGGFG